MDIVLSILIGIGLSAACGFRVFVPMAGLSLASITGHITLSPEFAWLGTWTALIAFSTATVLEIAAYYIPWLDNILDSLMTPAAIVAGIIATASVVADMSPFLKWTLAVIAGGGVAAVMQGGTVAIRASSSGATGGLANFSLSTVELIGAIIITILAFFLPIIAFFLVIVICFKMIKSILNSFFVRKLLA